MYKLKAINESMCTRTIELENELTKTIDLCFDDSALVSDNNNFEFMKLGDMYDCKIKLFGDFVDITDERVVEVSIINKKLNVGSTEFSEVKVDNDVYYIPNIKINNFPNKEKFLFKVSRKDIVQVNDVVHDDLL